MKQYFITMQVYNAKNNFDLLLKEAAKQFSHKVIDENCVDMIEQEYKRIESAYRAGGGKGQADFYKHSEYNDGCKGFNFGTTIISLYLVKGYISNKVDLTGEITYPPRPHAQTN